MPLSANHQFYYWGIIRFLLWKGISGSRLYLPALPLFASMRYLCNPTICLQFDSLRSAGKEEGSATIFLTIQSQITHVIRPAWGIPLSSTFWFLCWSIKITGEQIEPQLQMIILMLTTKQTVTSYPFLWYCFTTCCHLPHVVPFSFPDDTRNKNC